jgi:hypothetical protein
MGIAFLFCLPMIGQAMSNFMQSIAGAIISG